MGQTAPYPDLYDVLGAAREADPAALEAAYRARARELQPSTADDAEAEQGFRELSDAYAVLSRSRSRWLYDRLAYGSAGGARDPEATDEHVEPPTLDEVQEPEEPARLADPARRDERLLRYIAAAALVVSIVFLVAVLLA